jgi:hypothetical protein
MKNWIYSLIISLSLTTSAFAQPANIESVRAAFITQKLELTPEESQKFWPVYNSYHQEMKQLAIKKNQLRKSFKQNGAATTDGLEIETQMLELRKRYRQEFSKVLPNQKAAMVYPVEREFRQHLLETLKEKKHKN